MKAIILLLTFCPFSAAGTTIAERCQNNTVVVTSNYGHASGVLFTRADGQMTFVWTVAHAVNRVIKSDGTFDNLTIIRNDKIAEARILRASNHEIDHDVALLQIIDSDIFNGDTKFYQPNHPVIVGQPVIHVGTPLGKIYECSVFFGHISYVNRLYNRHPVVVPRLVDQIDITLMGGCSGGGIFDANNGQIMGVMSIGCHNVIGSMTPTRYIYAWAKSHDCLWAFDRNIALPETITPWLGDRYNTIDLLPLGE